jgi:hypothetical protein
MISIKTPGERDVEIPSIHPLLWMAHEFIKEVPVKKLPPELREIWENYQGCAFKAIVEAIRILTPVKFVDRDYKCMNQRIKIVVSQQDLEPIDFRSEGK